MDEAVNTLYETNSERSKMASSARNGRKGRSKMSACELPSDHMTKKQKENLNGPVTILELSHFYSWEEFKSFSMNQQVEYIKYLMEKYNVSLAEISVYVFGKSNPALGKYCQRHKLIEKLPLAHRGGSRSKAHLNEREQLILDIRASRSPIKEEVPEDTVESLFNSAPTTMTMPIASVTSCQFTLDGFDIPTFQRLKELFGNQYVELDIWVRPKEGTMHI